MNQTLKQRDRNKKEVGRRVTKDFSRKKYNEEVKRGERKRRRKKEVL